MNLRDSVASLPYVSSAYSKKLARLGIESAGDLLTHFPTYHRDQSEVKLLGEIEEEGKVVTQVRVEGVKSIRLRGGRTMQTATLFDAEGESMRATWFNQPYLINAFKPDSEYLIEGNVKRYRGSLGIFPNSYEEVYTTGKSQVHLGRIAPQYRLTAGLSIKWLRNRMKHLTDNLQEFDELSQLQSQLAMHKLPLDVRAALAHVHFPSDEEELGASVEKLQQLELVDLQLRLLAAEASRKKFAGSALKIDKRAVEQFIQKLSFQLTADQASAVEEILNDLESAEPMTRLLQGDVGSGKTIVAAIAALAAASAAKQTVILAPTTVLAAQHAQKFSEYFHNTPWRVELVTGTTKAGKDASDSEAPADIIIGTSAVLARKNNLITDLGLVVVDEQHRFGVKQRDELLAPLGLEADVHPDVLSMTATPIPRTLAMALFSDLKVSSIKTKPAGRLPIKTYLVSEDKRPDSYTWVGEQIRTTRQQAYWICPLIEESEKSDAASAKKTYETLKSEVFPDLKVELLHGKLKNEEKQEIMERFTRGETDILVSTSVIEVGIDVPNATIMVIEGADRFGLAQMHQIRGRVGRSDLQSWCFLFATQSEDGTLRDDVLERLEFFTKHTDGLEIATYDLHRRGPGEVYGTKQAGIPNLKIARLDNIDLVRSCREIAKRFWASGIKRINLFATST